jgi:nucleoside-diphosphate-sugar epimerase
MCEGQQRADGARNFSLEDVHVEGTERIADAVAKYDVDRFIHVSSYNADPNHISEFYSTKVPSLEPDPENTPNIFSRAALKRSPGAYSPRRRL